jgi:hypothetical protein
MFTLMSVKIIFHRMKKHEFLFCEFKVFFWKFLLTMFYVEFFLEYFPGPCCYHLELSLGESIKRGSE